MEGPTGAFQISRSEIRDYVLENLEVIRIMSFEFEGSIDKILRFGGWSAFDFLTDNQREEAIENITSFWKSLCYLKNALEKTKNC